MIHIVDATTPDAAAHFDQRRPQPRVFGQLRMRRQIGSRTALRQTPRAFVDVKTLAVFADEIHGPRKPGAIDDNFNLVAIAHFADGPPASASGEM